MRAARLVLSTPERPMLGKAIASALSSPEIAIDSAPTGATLSRRSSPSSSSRRTFTCAISAANGSRPILPAGGRKNRSSGGVAHLQMPETQAEAPGIVHEVGWAELNRVAISGTLLQVRRDLVVQRFEIDGSVRQPDRQYDGARDRQDSKQFGDPAKDVRDPLRAAPPARRKTRPVCGFHHAANVAACARACPDFKSTDQSRVVLRGPGADRAPASPTCERRRLGGSKAYALETRRAAGHCRAKRRRRMGGLKRQ